MFSSSSWQRILRRSNHDECPYRLYYLLGGVVDAEKAGEGCLDVVICEHTVLLFAQNILILTAIACISVALAVLITLINVVAVKLDIGDLKMFRT